MLPWILSAIAPIIFLLTTRAAGFPLDDAWIHQTYARNLAHYGEWAYIPGHPSAGSTAPLWSLLLALPYLLGLNYKAWTFSLGIALSGAITWAVQKFAISFGWGKKEAFLASCFSALEWHMAWAAVSGMEIPLFTFLSILSIALLLEGWPFQGRCGLRAVMMGLLLGLLCLTRPEGLILAILVFLVAIYRSPLKALTFAGGMSLCLVSYGAFNYHLSGNFFPNTFYAKAAEYRELVEKFPIWVRFWRVLSPALVGAQVMLLPGVFWSVVKGIKARDKAFKAVAILWIILLPLAYAFRLPVSYQHGRYVMPVIPVLVALGVPGTLELMAKIPVLLRRVWGISTLIILLAFLFLGARAYATDVGIIQCEMVNVAHWLARNTPPGSLIAVHDIGAIGYFSNRDILDLAGLVNPEVIPFIRNEKKLKEFILSRGADYLVTFPSWYPELTRSQTFVPIYSTGCSLTLKAGSDNIVVYAVKKASFQKPPGSFNYYISHAYGLYDLVPPFAPLLERTRGRGYPGRFCLYFNDRKLCSYPVPGRDRR